ncbi:hypothetical protein L6164_019928 [Bauhinia variegata]|uniref:Uncharacterized protein n=1 Tax=Bauhinia variegata TaxID=167791 RepID=A0ACB9MY54_BAUVA|nr:hypothetical protein L6164_019928 [Bauhinia variegata]
MGLQAISKYLAILLALFVLHEALSAHGRQIKTMNNQQSSVNQYTVGPKDSLQPTTKYHVSGFGDDVNAFRPTTPGNSPGVGHKIFAGQETKLHVHSPDADSVTERFKNGLRTTEPGHSPGVGHVRENINGGPN